MLKSSAILLLLVAAAWAGQPDEATVRLDAAQPAHEISRLVYGANVVYFGMTCEDLGFLAPHLKHAGITNLRFHTSSDPDYLWDTHTVRKGSNPDKWRIYDNPLRDDNPFEKNKFLKKVIDPGNAIHADHYNRTDLRCCGLIVKRPGARNAYGEARLPKPLSTVYARCDIRVEDIKAIIPGDEQGWRFLALKDAAGRRALSASLRAGGLVTLYFGGEDKTLGGGGAPIKAGEWTSVEVAAEDGKDGAPVRLWVNGSPAGESRGGVPVHIASVAFGAIDCAATGELRIDAGVVDDKPIGTKVDEARAYLRRVTFDRDPINTDDFMAYCREIGAEPLLQLPLVNKPTSWTPDYCAAWLEYCNGAPTTRWGKLRADRGHTELYRVRFVETSNEPYYGDDWRSASAQYVAIQREVIPKLKAVDPGVLCIFNTNYHNADVFPPLKDLVDGVGMRHFYGEQLGKKDAEQLPWLLGSSVAIRKDKRAPQGKDEIATDLYADWPWLRKTFGAREVFFAQTEYDYWLRYHPDKVGTLGCAIYKAGMLLSLMKHNVRIADTFYLPPARSACLEAYSLLTSQFTPADAGACRFVPAEVTCAETPFDTSYGKRPEYNSYVLPILSAAGSLSQDGKGLSVLLIHRGTSAPLAVRMALAGFEPAKIAASVLTGSSVETPEATPVPLAVEREAGGLRLQLPPLAIAVVRASR